MLTGEYKVSIDEKGRLIVPSRLRTEIPGNTLILTRGVDECLWLFLPEDWQKISQSLMQAASPFQNKARLLQRRIIAPSQEIELDKLGRVNIPSTLVESAGLQKECLILGLMKYIEIWDVEVYQRYNDSTAAEFKEAAEELGGLISF
jgi:MraZ protein